MQMEQDKFYRNTYDVIVMGDNLSGLVAASILAKRGLGILFVSKNRNPFYFFSEGYRLNNSPHLISGIGKGGYFRKVFDEAFAGRPTDIIDDLYYQILLPENRLDMDRNVFLEEIKREFPDDFEKFEKFYNVLNTTKTAGLRYVTDLKKPYTGTFFQKMQLRKYYKKKLFQNDIFSPQKFDNILSNCGDSDEFKRFLLAQIISANLVVPKKISEFILSWYLLKNSKLELETNMTLGDVYEVLIDRLRVLRGSVSSFDEVESMKVGITGIKSCKFKNMKRDVFGRYYIINGDYEKNLPFLKTFIGKSTALKFFEKVKPIYKRITLNIIVDADVIPRELKNSAVYIYNKNKDLTYEDMIVINVSKEGSTCCGKDERIISAAMITKAQNIEPKKIDYKLFNHLYDSLCGLIPFLKKYTKKTFPSLDEWSKEGEEYYDSVLSNEYNTIYDYNGELFLNMYGMPEQANMKNVFVTGRLFMPSMGFAGEIYQGQKLADHIYSKIGF